MRFLVEVGPEVEGFFEEVCAFYLENFCIRT